MLVDNRLAGCLYPFCPQPSMYCCSQACTAVTAAVKFGAEAVIRGQVLLLSVHPAACCLCVVASVAVFVVAPQVDAGPSQVQLARLRHGGQV
jgi:hypothetical protein